MVVPIDENILLGFIAAIFVPFIGLLVKLLIDVGVIKNTVVTLQKQIDKMEEESKVSGRGVRR